METTPGRLTVFFRFISRPNCPKVPEPQLYTIPESRVTASAWFSPHETLAITLLARISTSFGVFTNCGKSLCSDVFGVSPSLPLWLLPIAYSRPLLLRRKEKSSPQATAYSTMLKEHVFGLASFFVLLAYFSMYRWPRPSCPASSLPQT